MEIADVLEACVPPSENWPCRVHGSKDEHCITQKNIKPSFRLALDDSSIRSSVLYAGCL